MTNPALTQTSTIPDVSGSSSKTEYFSISGMHTRACESYLERLATDTEGVHAASASYTTEVMRVEYDPNGVDRETIEDNLSQWGYRASEPTPGETAGERNDFDFQHFRMIFSFIVISLVYLFYVSFFYPVYLGIFPGDFLESHIIIVGVYGPLALFTTAIIFGVGFPILRSAYISLQERRLTVDVLISLSALITYGYSIVSLAFFARRYVFFDVATTIIVIATVGNYIRAKYKRRAVKGLADRLSTTDTVVHRLSENGGTESVSISDCGPGDRFLVRPGEQIPLDGVILNGRGTVNEALVTGEARPQQKHTGDDVIGGSAAIDGAFEVEVGEDATSTLDQLRDLVWELQADQLTTERLTNRIIAVYTLFVGGLSVVTFVAWIALGAIVDTAFQTALTVVIVACPVALSLVAPLAIGRGVAIAADRGIPILDQTTLERITDADVVAFDKTGTLTTGEMRIVDITATESTETLLRRAAAVESYSAHPIAATIRAQVDDPIESSGFERHQYGVVATVDGAKTAVGNPALFDELGWECPSLIQTAISQIRERGELPTVVGWEGKVTGVIALADTPRDGWSAVVEELQTDSRRIVVITGDNALAAEQFETHPGIDEVFADVSPEEKEEIIANLKQDGTVAMVGDGTNDAPALASADLGVAMVSGSDFTVTVADALITDDTLEPFAELFIIAKQTRRRLLESLGLALVTPLIGLPLAVAGFVTPIVAAGLMALGAILVLVNSRRSFQFD